MRTLRALGPACLLALLLILPATAAPTDAADEGEAMRLVHSWSLSPDGSTLYLSWRGDLWRVASKGGDATRLTSHDADDRHPYLSPDGSTLAFVSNRHGADHVYVMPATGGPAKRVTTYTGGFILYGWYPDGKALLVRTRKDHHWRRPDRFFRRSLDPLDGLEMLFDAYGGSPSLSPDGTQLLFVREGVQWWRKDFHGASAGQIWRYDMETQTFTKLTKGDHGERWPIWSADGKEVFYSSQENGSSMNLWRMTPDGSGRRQLTKFDDDSVVFPRIAAKGRTVVFRRLFDLYRFELGANKRPERLDIRFRGEPILEPVERSVLSRATDVAFSDDAREIAFVAGGDIWVMDTELREPKRVTNTPAEEREPVFSKDFSTLTFVSDAAGQPDVFQAKRADAEAYWWQNDVFVIRRLTDDPAPESNLRLTPDGEHFAFVHGNGHLVTMKTDGTDRQVLLEHWDDPDYDFSPDGKWLTWSKSDNDFNNDVWIMPVDKSRAPFNVSLHPDYDFNPRWSKDGKVLAWVGRRAREETDIYYVWLRRSDDEQRTRDRTLEKALKKMKGRKVPTPPKPPGDPEPHVPETSDAKAEGADPYTGTWTGTLVGPPPFDAGLAFSLVITRADERLTASLDVPGQLQVDDVPITVNGAGKTLQFEADTPIGPLSGSGQVAGARIEGTWEIEGVAKGTFSLSRGEAPPSAPAAGAKKTAPAKAKPAPSAKKPKKAKEVPPVEIDFEGLTDRVRRISIPRSEPAELLWSPEGAKLAFRATIDGKAGLYTVSFPDSLKPKLLSTSRGSNARWIAEGNQIAWLSGGRPATLSSRGALKTFAFSVRHEVDRQARNGAAFEMAWRVMRDNFYDENLGNRDWTKIRDKYLPMAETATTGAELELVVNLMLGELNGSHLGFRSTERKWRATGWQDETGHLGCLFDPAYEGPGLRVRRVIPGTPASETKTRIQEGETIRAIDGRPVEPETNLSRLLTGDPKRSIEVKVVAEDGTERLVSLMPTSHGAVRRQLYDVWQADARAHVDELSKGTLGYLHIRGMSWSSFEKFEAELYKVGHGKDGLVIDVRENGGGFTTDHLLTCLTQPQHAITVPRGGGKGYPQGRMVYARWNKPIVVLCNQNSFSNAEIFSHAIKQLKRGQLVGVPTAGGVISTGGTTIMGVGTLRLPFRGWYLAEDGQDMERNGCVPHHVLWPHPGELPAGIDRQLDKAVEVLLADVDAWKARPRPSLTKASERAR
ncbi:MAG: S41 family peptidase [Planctomycetota bacterium]|nr:S41 family peptidase [Planctomycetota bacterium]